jgi:outer membrane protein assembly factor BamB
MTTTYSDARLDRKPLRLWPGVVVAALVVLGRFVLPLVWPDGGAAAVLVAVAGAALILIWWLFFSRAAWVERIGAIAVTVAAVVALKPLMHASIRGGMMGMMYPVFAVPAVVPVALVLWAAATRNRSDRFRRVTMVLTIVLACASWLLLRTDGILGGTAQLAWRWTPTPEDRLLAQAADEPSAPKAAVEPAPSPAATIAAAPPVPASDAKPPATLASAEAVKPEAIKTDAPHAPAVVKAAEWPGFRGPARDGVVRGAAIATDWSASPPVQMWRRPVGPGWSSFAVSGDLLYTQEQRGPDEIVACYRVSTGAPVWRHRDGVRFWESNGGAGPRGTPTLSGGRVYSLGATGILNALDAATGALVWSRNVSSDTHIKVPGWGFSSSPLVVDGRVVVAASGALAAYDENTGERRWTVASTGASYSSPQLMTLDGVPQIVLLTGNGAKSVSPSTGAVLWESPWEGSVTIVQPAVIGDRDVLISTTAGMGGMGTRRLAVAHAANRWTAEERWTSNGLKPYFNDSVVHKGYAFGFDGNILSCIDLNDGTRKWKGGRYGGGQLVLLADQDLLLVISEEGELALVNATPDQFTEVTRFPALEGKTWNHPVVVHGVLLVRNDQEMAAFRLPAGGAGR